ncbi:hypothetical protein PHYC_03385 [Phycisphaerales bacterium]|nr:hypothetical protein PHYC_03385 [Phycisphaerales bacterium]
MRKRFLASALICGTCAGAGADVITIFNFDTSVVGGRNLSYLPTPDNSLSPPGPGSFPGSSNDLWGAVIESINDDVLDDSMNDPFDLFGILIEDFDGMAFAAEDLDNPNNPSATASATWTFDISGYADVRVMIRAAAMGNFETIDCSLPPCLPDQYVFSAAIDGGTPVVVFEATADEAITQTYTLQSGVQVVLDDPLRMNGVVLSNAFQDFTSGALGSGTTLALTLTGQGDSSEEVFIFDDIVLTGTPLPACDPDVNCDGSINGFDIEAMEQAVNGDVSNFCQADADFNRDGAVNGFDVEAVEQSVNGAPCP